MRPILTRMSHYVAVASVIAWADVSACQAAGAASLPQAVVAKVDKPHYIRRAVSEHGRCELQCRNCVNRVVRFRAILQDTGVVDIAWRSVTRARCVLPQYLIVFLSYDVLFANEQEAAAKRSSAAVPDTTRLLYSALRR